MIIIESMKKKKYRSVSPGFRSPIALGALITCICFTTSTGAESGHSKVITTKVEETGYSIQAALDATPGKPINLPPGNHLISEALIIRHSGTGLYGPRRIRLSNPQAAFIELHNVQNDLWSIGLMPGTASRTAVAATDTQTTLV